MSPIHRIAIRRIARKNTNNSGKIVITLMPKWWPMRHRRLASQPKNWILSRWSMQMQCPEFGQCWRQIQWKAAFQLPPSATIFSTIKTSNGWSDAPAKMTALPQLRTPNARNGYTNLSSTENDSTPNPIIQSKWNSMCVMHFTVTIRSKKRSLMAVKCASMSPQWTAIWIHSRMHTSFTKISMCLFYHRLRQIKTQKRQNKW